VINEFGLSRNSHSISSEGNCRCSSKVESINRNNTIRWDKSIKLPISQRNIDERLKKIGQARENLTEALQAIDDLQATAEDNRQDLENLDQAILRAEEQRAGLAAELTALKGLADLDSKAVREALRLPTEVDKWRERIWGFIFGLLAGLVATVLWELVIKPSLPDKYLHESPAMTMPADNTKAK